jgi:hypothetical protein
LSISTIISEGKDKDIRKNFRIKMKEGEESSLMMRQINEFDEL